MNLKEHEFVVFGVEHYNPLGVIRSLGEYGIQPVAIVIKGGPRLTSKSKYLKKVFYVDSRDDGLKILLNTYSNKKNKTFVYSCDDNTATYLDQHYEELHEDFYFFNAGKAGRLSEFLNKETIGALAEKYGLNFLQARVVKKGIVPDDLIYPVITKAIDSTVGGWKNDMYICINRVELNEAYKHILSPTVMIQKYIVKKNEYCLEGFSCNKGNDIFISIESTYNYNLPKSYSPYMTVNNFSNRSNILPALRTMFKEVGFEGIFEVEFLESESGVLYFGEINFRNSTWSYASTCAGMNLPVLWAKSMVTGRLINGCYKEIGQSGFTAVVELTDFKERVLNRHYSIIKWIRDVKRCKCKYYLAKGDLKPVLIMGLDRVLRRS